MIKIITISDTHNRHYELSKDLASLITDYENTIVLHAGDITMQGKTKEIVSFLTWFGNLKCRYKCFIAGNHDWAFEDNHEIAPMFQDMGIVYLMDKMVELNGIKIYGSPWQPRFNDWAFNVDRGAAIAKKWETIPQGMDIVMTHGPLYGILDNTYAGLRVGCEELYKKIVEVKPRYHVCGHVHHSYGTKIMDGTTFVNASSLGESYRYRNKPISFYL